MMIFLAILCVAGGIAILLRRATGTDKVEPWHARVAAVVEPFAEVTHEQPATTINAWTALDDVQLTRLLRDAA